MHQRFQHPFDPFILIRVRFSHPVRGAQIALAACEVEDVVADELVQLGLGQGSCGVDASEEMEESGVVGFCVFGEDAGADDENVSALGECVGAVGCDEGFAEFAHGEG